MATVGSSPFYKSGSTAYPDTQYNATVSNIPHTIGGVFESISQLVRPPQNEMVQFGTNRTVPYEVRTLFDANKVP